MSRNAPRRTPGGVIGGAEFQGNTGNATHCARRRPARPRCRGIGADRATIGFKIGVASIRNRNRAPDMPLGMLEQGRHFAQFRAFQHWQTRLASLPGSVPGVVDTPENVKGYTGRVFAVPRSGRLPGCRPSMSDASPRARPCHSGGNGAVCILTQQDVSRGAGYKFKRQELFLQS